MDLSRLESLTREMLEAEARRRGIKSPEFRTRTELVRLIVRHQYGDRIDAGRGKLEQSVKTARTARAFMAGALSAALEMLPEKLGILDRLSGKRTLPDRPYTPTHDRAPSTWPGPRPSARAGTSTEPQAQPERARASEAQLIGEPAPVAVPEVSAAPALSTTHEAYIPPAHGAKPAHEPQEVTASDYEALEVARKLQAAAIEQRERLAQLTRTEHIPREPRATTTRTFIEEPIRTRSMAQLLAAQGHAERALAIYEELLAQNSDDAVLLREAAALRRGEPVPEVALPTPPAPIHSPSTAPSGVWSSSKEKLECDGQPESGLVLRWNITGEGERRARALLGLAESDGELTVRLVAIRPDPDQVVRSEITEHGPVSASGQWELGPLADVARCVATVGLRAGDRFVSIVHMQP
jgi:hypothetical protein